MNKINNNLPKSWVVKHIWDDRFKEIVIKYLNDTYNDCLDGSCGGDYYGVNENNEVHYDGFLTSFGNPTVLTIDEFIELSKPIKNNNVKEEYHYHLWCEDKLYYNGFRLLVDAEDEAYILSEKLKKEVIVFKSICTIKPIVKPIEYIKINHE